MVESTLGRSNNYLPVTAGQAPSSDNIVSRGGAGSRKKHAPQPPDAPGAGAPDPSAGPGATATHGSQLVPHPDIPPPAPRDPGAGNGQSGDQGPAPPGAPVLPAPGAILAGLDASVIAELAMMKVDDDQMTSEEGSITSNSARQQENAKLGREKTEAAAAKLQQASHKKKWLGILGTIGKVLGGVAAVALTVATGGAASPLLVAFTAYTILDTTLTVADAISQAKGGPHLDLNTLLSEGVADGLEKCGVNAKEAKKIGQWTAMGIQAAIAVATLAYGAFSIIQSLRGVATVARTTTGVAQTAMKAAKMTGIAAQAMGGATQISAGALTISAAGDQKSALQKTADKTRLDANTALLQETIQKSLGLIQELASNAAGGMELATQAVQKFAQTNMTVANGGRMV